MADAKSLQNISIFSGAGGGTRTLTHSRAADFERAEWGVESRERVDFIGCCFHLFPLFGRGFREN